MYSIRYKILSLSLLGMFGMVAIAGVNQYLDYLKNVELEVGLRSQEIVRYTLQNMILEEQFVQESGIRSCSKSTKSIKKSSWNATKQILVLSKNHSIQEVAKRIQEIGISHDKIFTSFSENIVIMNQHKESIMSLIHEMTDIINKIVECHRSGRGHADHGSGNVGVHQKCVTDRDQGSDADME